ncbi:conserved Plasmodium protein, unknown function [Plasmodium ovale]|uniref:Uncharacterized protein n=2 Tax=Plasmodium ovale TaxID=36330 RepID=A0A1A8VW14_PLAOA|nr:conserved Plasmodium protein, unknown function [Plasmodium ovale curtisi]SBS83887.1 conserved Plasmodium protein, unknown function [Plasmodium ovale curtisi]SCP03843.1 conserved Plasmodium protein, unknown function [Plasmodium ovale]
MSLNFSDDDEVYEHGWVKKGENDNLSQDEAKRNYDDKNEEEKSYYSDKNEGMFEEKNEVREDEESDVKNKKKRKKSMTFQLKNIFNDVALNKINSYIKKKKKKEEKNNYGGEEISEDEESCDKDNFSEEDELAKYVKEERNKIKQIIPEKDELWDIYIYLNLKKKKRKIHYNEKDYTVAIKKVLDYVQKEYTQIINEKLFRNKTFEQYLIIRDPEIFYQSSNIENVEKNTSIPIIRKKNILMEIKKRLVELYNKGNCFSYLKEVTFPMNSNDGKEDNLYEEDDNINNMNDNYDHKKNVDTNFIIEKEKLNMELAKLSDKYIQMIKKIKQHKRKDLRTSFNQFMNLINEVTSKLYFSIHNVLLMNDGNTNLADVYKTIRRKYNIHDVIEKVQKLTQKKEIYEHYRSYLIYKYKTTYPVCDDVFKTHQMMDDINIFNFKKFYNTEFSMDNFSVIRKEETEGGVTEGLDGLDTHVTSHGNKEKIRERDSEELFANDVYESDDFFHINVPKEIDANEKTTAETKAKADAESQGAAKKQESHGIGAVKVPSLHTADGSAASGGTGHPEETPLERAKRIAREKRQKLMESRVKII